MRLFGIIFLSASFVYWTGAEDVFCSKKMRKVVTIEDGESFMFKTQPGAKYAAKSRCEVTYKTGPSCPSIQFSCSEFDLDSKKVNCNGGDKMTVVADGKNEKFCQTSSPDVTATKTLKVVFTSNKKKQSSGALCTAQCASDPSTTTATTATSPTTTPTSPGAAVGNNEYFVSLSGSDDDGIPGAESSPWRTLNHAVDQLRMIRPNPPGPPDEATITLRAGVYFQTSMITLGRKDRYLKIQNYKDEEVSLSGGFPLDLVWQKQGDVLSGSFNGSCLEAYYGNYRLLPARSPNIEEWGPNRNIAKGPYHTVTDLLVEAETCKRNTNVFSQTCPEEDRNGFIFNDEFSEDWQYLNQTKILIFQSWIAEYAQVANISVENGRRKIMFQDRLKHAAVGDYNKAGNWRFLIFNNLAVLDMPGEYVCVEDGGLAQFSFIPPTDVEASIPVMSNLETIIYLLAASNVTISGINFEHNSYKGQDYWNFGDAAVKVIRSEDININNCMFSHTAMMGLYVKDTSHISVQQNVFYDIGYHGLMMRGGNMTEDILLANNYFDGCGISRFWQPVCLWVHYDGEKHNVYARNNEITNTANGGIMAKSGAHGANFWADNGITDPGRDDYLLHVEFNYIHDFGQGILSDYGAIKTGVQSLCDDATWEHEQSSCHTYIHVYNNLIHDGKAYQNGENFLYSDASSSRNTFENNIMYGTGSIALYHHCGVDNVSKNNIVHRTAAPATTDTHNIEYIWGGCARSSYNFQSYSNFNNIYLLENSASMSFYKGNDRFDQDSPDFYKNLYWSQDPNDTNSKSFPFGLNFTEWTKTGNDSMSEWANPQLEDPSSGLYTLGPNSPAFGLGIKQIQLDNFGVQKHVKLFYKKN